jgi:hypothetical protein
MPPSTAKTAPVTAPAAAVAPAPAALPTLTTEQAKALGDTFLKAQDATEKAEGVLDQARAKKSDAVAAIVAAFGHKGPFNIGGRLWGAKQSKSTGSFSMTEMSGAKATL